MRSNPPLGVEALEGRQLLTTAGTAAVALGDPSLAGHAVVHAAVAAMPLDLGGTLAVNSSGKQANYDSYGNVVVTMPLRGTLNGVGPVRGTWVQTQDHLGNLTGPDELHLQNARGAVTVSFRNPVGSHGTAAARLLARVGLTSNASSSPSTATAAQHVTGASKAYNHATESGTLTIIVSDSGRSIRSLVLTSTAPTL